MKFRTKLLNVRQDQQTGCLVMEEDSIQEISEGPSHYSEIGQRCEEIGEMVEMTCRTLTLETFKVAESIRNVADGNGKENQSKADESHEFCGTRTS